MERKRIRLRVIFGIILINAFFVVLSGSIIIVSMWINAENNARQLADALKNEIQSSVSSETIRYFFPGNAVNQSLTYLLYHYFQNPIDNTENGEHLFGFYHEVMKSYPQFKMIYYADTDGNLVMLNRMNDGSFSRRYVTNDGNEISIKWNHENIAYNGLNPNTVESAQTGYDPRKRGWYISAENERSPIWTPVYLFATDNLPGFTCAIPIFDEDGFLKGVSSIDIAVDELSRFLGTIQPTPRTSIFILDKQKNLIALQAFEEKDLDKLFVQSIDERGNNTFNVTSIAAMQDEETSFLLEEILENKSGLSLIKYKNEHYITSLVPISIGDGLELTICIITPENDILGSVRTNSRNVVLFSILILVIVPFVSAFFSQSIAKPMRILADEMSKIKTFELDSYVTINTNFMEIIDMQESFENMRSGLKSFKRYVPADLVAQLINQNITADLGGEEREMTMFFSDIAKFTSIAEKTEPEKLVQDLCVYFEIVSKTILGTKGTIDKYIGDAVMAFWGAPVKIDDHAQKACHAALLVRNNLHTLYRQWENQGKVPFHTRIGIHTGNVIVGNLGYKERLDYTVIGDAVNVCSRLEGINKVYGTEIIVSENTYEQATDEFEFRLLDRVSLLGRYEGMNIYELVTFKNDLDKSFKKIYQYYETGLKYYFHKNWKEGLKYFNTVIKYRPNDTPAKLMKERCLLYQRNPPPDDWNGVFAQSVK
ncbi:MAG: adenylate/guanylate cyclase domain-containing protein [Treponema sp.]|nr:adenylate/guanylate cyclase domain-containing protein [Treponema sp.]